MLGTEAGHLVEVRRKPTACKQCAKRNVAAAARALAAASETATATASAATASVEVASTAASAGAATEPSPEAPVTSPLLYDELTRPRAAMDEVAVGAEATSRSESAIPLEAGATASATAGASNAADGLSVHVPAAGARKRPRLAGQGDVSHRRASDLELTVHRVCLAARPHRHGHMFWGTVVPRLYATVCAPPSSRPRCFPHAPPMHPGFSGARSARRRVAPRRLGALPAA
jgi:hypothetical protein